MERTKDVPGISLVVPVYNVQEYLPECLDSLLGQSFAAIEIILVDDGSTDASGAVCDSYAERDSRIRVVHQRNAGVSGARNAGIRLARGRYLGFVDSDDWVDRDFCRTLYRGGRRITGRIFPFVRITRSGSKGCGAGLPGTAAIPSFMTAGRR